MIFLERLGSRDLMSLLSSLAGWQSVRIVIALLNLVKVRQTFIQIELFYTIYRSFFIINLFFATFCSHLTYYYHTIPMLQIFFCQSFGTLSNLGSFLCVYFNHSNFLSNFAATAHFFFSFD